MTKLKKILKSAQNHCDDHEDTLTGRVYQVGDLEEALRIAWKHLGEKAREETIKEFEEFVGFWED